MKKISVAEFMQQLNHPSITEIEMLRKIIMEANSELTEQIKWNAPSFCFNGDDRITFRIQPSKSVQLIFHRGAKVRADSSNFSFDDPSGLIQWASTDRGYITFKDKNDIESKKNDLIIIVQKWINATID